MNYSNLPTTNTAQEAVMNPLLQPKFTFANAEAQQPKPWARAVDVIKHPATKKVAIIGSTSALAIALMVGTFVGVSNMREHAKQAKLQRESRIVVL